MNRFDQLFQPGSRFLIGLGAVLTGAFIVLAVADPARRYIAFFMVLMGLIGTWRQVKLRRRQHDGGLLDVDTSG